MTTMEVASGMMVSLALLRRESIGWDAYNSMLYDHLRACTRNPNKEDEGCRMWSQYLRTYQQTVRLLRVNFFSDRIDDDYESVSIDDPREYGGHATDIADRTYTSARTARYLRQVIFIAVSPPIEALRVLGPWFKYRDTGLLDRSDINNPDAEKLFDAYQRSSAAIIYGLTVMLCDGLLAIGAGRSRQQRFWRIVEALPIELQAVLALRFGGKNGVTVSMSPFMWQAVAAMVAIPPPEI